MNYFPNGGSGAMPPSLPPSAAIVNTNQGVGLPTHPVSPQVVQVAEHRILCCQCGVAIAPNPSNMCVGCLRTKVDITSDIPKQVVIYFCRFCERYLNPPQNWVTCALESRELMALCLKRLKNIQRVKLVDASFVWTEPHSKRVKVKLTVQGEVVAGTILQQSFIVEYVVNHQMCDDCRRVEAKDTWNASVQLRQKAIQKKTLYFVEQLLIKYDATKECSAIKAVGDGLDFYFGAESGARKLVEFFQSVVPMRYQHAKKLISHDMSSNIYNYKYTLSVEVVPICKDNVVCLPEKLAHSLGGIGQICVVYKVTSKLHLIDPNTCQFAEISAATFFKTPFSSLQRPRQLCEYTIINIEEISDHERRKFAGQGALSRKYGLADAWVVKTSQLGKYEENAIHCRTHLGHLLQPGDTVLGFDLKNSNVNDPQLEKMSEDKISDVVLVKKVYAEKSVRNRRRKWRLKHMEGLHETVGGSNSMSDGGYEYNDFLEDLEEDPELRKNVNVYKDPAKIAVDRDSVSESEDIPQITLAEMLDDLDIGPKDENSTLKADDNGRSEKVTDGNYGVSDTPMME